MLKLALLFAILALVSGALGFTGIAGGFAFIAKFLFFLFLVAVLVTVILGVTIFRAIT